jgi:hypothetical protein
MRLKEFALTISRGSESSFLLRNNSENKSGRYFCFFVSVRFCLVPFDVVFAGL